MELGNYLRLLRRGALVILLFLLVGVAVGLVLTLTTKATYATTAQIFVSSNSSTDPGDTLQGGNSFTQDRTASYAVFAQSPDVAQGTLDILKQQGVSTSLTPSDVMKRLSADAQTDKVIINLTAEDGSPTLAAALANAAATAFANKVESSEPQLSDKPVVKLTTALPAAVPTTPVSPHKVINLGLGALIGLVLGVGLVTLRDALDNSVKGPADFDAVNVATLGVVPFDRRADAVPIAFRGDPHSSRAEAYRAIRTNMQFVDVDNPPHVIAITSAMPGEGKTAVSINLAAALAEAGFRVCLIDADFRRPTIAAKLGLITDVGFTTALISDTPIEDVLQNAGQNLAVLASGRVPPNPSELLISAHARSVIADISEKVDFVVIDTPPLLPVTDAAEIASIADATVFVARARKTTTDQLGRAMVALANVGEKPVGAVLNMVSNSRSNPDQYSGYYYASYRPQIEPARRRRSAGARKASRTSTAHVEQVEPSDASADPWIDASLDEPVEVDQSVAAPGGTVEAKG